MINHILHEIRRMEMKYREKTGNRGEVIFLDANAETKLAAYMVYSDFVHNESRDKVVEEILESGIRSLDATVYGMKLRFDCPSFCIEGPITVTKDWMTSHKW